MSDAVTGHLDLGSTENQACLLTALLLTLLSPRKNAMIESLKCAVCECTVLTVSYRLFPVPAGSAVKE